MKGNCLLCGVEIEIKRYSVCPECKAKNHYKINKRGKVKKQVCHGKGKRIISKKK